MDFGTNSIKTYEQCLVSPSPSPSTTTHLSLPLTFFDLIWLKFHPAERLLFYTLPPHDPSYFFEQVVPKLKTSLSLALQKFLPLAGNIIWSSDTPTPMIQYNPGSGGGGGVSFVIAESNLEFNNLLDKSPREAAESRVLLPNLDASDSTASIISFKITLFPNNGFCIGICAHHAVVDGKSLTMFIKAWASICETNEEEALSFSLVPELEPFFDRDVIKDPTHLDLLFMDNWLENPSGDDSNKEVRRSLKIPPNAFQPVVENSLRATFELTRTDLDKLKKRVLSKWDNVVKVDDEVRPDNMSSFVLTCAYVSTCIARAIQETEKNEQKFAFGFPADCRARLDPPTPENYFGNCVYIHIVDTKPEDFIKEDGFVIVAKKILSKIKKLENGGVLDGVETMFSRFMSMGKSGVKVIGVGGSSRFGVYGADFGWGRPTKVEIMTLDRGLTIGMGDRKDGKGGLELGLVLKKNVMEIFNNLFHAGL